MIIVLLRSEKEISDTNSNKCKDHNNQIHWIYWDLTDIWVEKLKGASLNKNVTNIKSNTSITNLDAEGRVANHELEVGSADGLNVGVNVGSEIGEYVGLTVGG